MTTAGGGFVLLWIAVVGLFFLARIAFDCWYHRRRGPVDWWYTEINRDPAAGAWYYGSRAARVTRLRES